MTGRHDLPIDNGCSDRGRTRGGRRRPGARPIGPLLLGLTAATRGRVEIDGTDVFAHFDRFRGRVAAVFQTDRLLPWKTAIANVRLPLEILGRREGDLPVAPAQWIARLGLGGFEDAYPHELSGGMRQRVAIARPW